MIAQKLARVAGEIHYSELPQDVIDAAKAAFEDALAVGLAGANTDIARTMRSAFPSSISSSIVWGTSEFCDSMTAALLNAAAIHVLDFDDCYTKIGGHPSAALVAAILALCEQNRLSGVQAIEAYVAGFETQSFLAEYVMPEHYKIGWHPTSTLGLFGATAACSKLLGLDEFSTATALSAAVSFVSGTKGAFGTSLKSLQVGMAARNGLQAALLAKAGCDADLTIFEKKKGFFDLFNNGIMHDAQRGQENKWGLLDPGISYKQYPCCGSTHCAIDAAMKLFAELGPIDPSNLKQINILMHLNRLGHTDNPQPRSGLDAKFSVQFVVAKALTDGKVNLSDFADPFDMAPFAALMSKINIVASEEMEEFLANIELVEANGATHVSSAVNNLGRDFHNPMSDAEKSEKFVSCLLFSNSGIDGELLLQDIRTLESFEDMSVFARRLAKS